MTIKTIDSKILRDMIRVSDHHLTKNAEFVNSLNVFPVPDGDTGTNMSLTFQSGAKAGNEIDSESVGEILASFSKGLLMGARGNSGVITSQIFRGFAKTTEGKNELTAEDLVEALNGGVRTAYKAVMKPVEGTILTVARFAADAATEKLDQNGSIEDIMEAAVEGAKKGLSETTNLLPILKKVGLVDSGGQGLLFIYQGFLSGIKGEKLVYQPSQSEMDEMINGAHSKTIGLSTGDIQYGYCTEMMIQLDHKKSFDNNKFREVLADYGDSLLVISDDDVAKVHIHTEKPATIFSLGKEYGDLSKIKIDNMRNQHDEITQVIEEDNSNVEQELEHTKFGIISIVAGRGLSKLFRSLGVKYVLDGGQTMNPSTQEILDAMDSINADEIIILPNNSNIFLSAQQAAVASDKPTKVIQSKTIAQGLSALIYFNPDGTLDDNYEEMSESLDSVTSGQVTQAVRDTDIDGQKINKDDYMGIVNGKIQISTNNLKETNEKLIDSMVNDDSEIITIIYGEEGSVDEANRLNEYVEDKYPDLEIEIHDGGQPVYPYLISVE